MALAAGAVPANRQAALIVPVHLVQDSRVTWVAWRAELLHGFWWHIWPEAVRDFGRCGVRLQSSFGEGEVVRFRGREPAIWGLEPGAINLVITDQLPLEWDRGLALSGVTTQYRGRHLCMVALNHAHGHQVPLLSTNTCVHELLHVLLLDIFEKRPEGVLGEARELRIDWYATGLWLFHDGFTIRKSAQEYVERFAAIRANRKVTDTGAPPLL